MKFVKRATKMDDETFIKHVNARHVPIAGMPHIKALGDGEALSRAYHARVHRLGFEEGRAVNHTHRGDEE